MELQILKADPAIFAVKNLLIKVKGMWELAAAVKWKLFFENFKNERWKKKKGSFNVIQTTLEC